MSGSEFVLCSFGIVCFKHAISYMFTCLHIYLSGNSYLLLLLVNGE